MKTNQSNKFTERGSVLLVTLATAVILGFILVSFLELIQGRMTVRARGLSWNQAIPVLESGIEEALTHLWDDSTNLTANGWSKIGSGATVTYRRTQTNSDSTFYITTISNLSPYPYTYGTVFSQGFVPAPLKVGYIARTVVVTLTNSTNFGHAIAARGKIDLNGQSVVDSYDPNNNAYSTGHKYDPAKRKGGGSVVTNARGAGAVDVGNGHLYGSAATGPGGTATYNGGGTLGDPAWSATHTGIQPGFTSDAMNAYYDPPSPPSGFTSWPALAKASGAAAKVNGTNYSYVVSGNASYTGAFNLNGSDTMIVIGDASLYVSGDFTVKTFIYIANGASLKVYVAGGTTSIAGNGIANANGTPSSFSYYGLAGNTTVKYSGGADFIGTVNAPNADFTMSGGASMYGSAIVNTFTSKSSGSGFHYDESLGTVGALRVTSYREI